MKILPISQNMDVTSIPQINRFTDMINIYIIETKSDYALLPQPIKDMVGAVALAALQA